MSNGVAASACSELPGSSLVNGMTVVWFSPKKYVENLG